MTQRNASPAQNGNALFMILIAIVLFAALTFVISQQRDTGKALSQEKIRLLASDVLDMGNKMSDTIAQLRLRRIKNTELSFENTLIAGYANANCLTDACKIFAPDGGGRDWETAVPEINQSKDWFYTGDIAIQDMGTTEADLVAVLPNLNEAVCNQINRMIGVYGLGGTPDQFNGITANKFAGTFAIVPIPLSSAQVQGKKSACIKLRNPNGTAIAIGLPSDFFAFYQVLEAR